MHATIYIVWVKPKSKGDGAWELYSMSLDKGTWANADEDLRDVTDPSPVVWRKATVRAYTPGVSREARNSIHVESCPACKARAQIDLILDEALNAAP